VVAGLEKARAVGKTLGRPALVVDRAKVWVVSSAAAPSIVVVRNWEALLPHAHR
jgi:hypothetical protein